MVFRSINLSNHSPVLGGSSGPALTTEGNMKQFKIDVSNASPGQLLTIALELKIMSNGWAKYGPRILINGNKLQAPSLRIPGSAKSRKQQATSLTSGKH